MADAIPWDVFEKKYSGLFKANTGNVAKPLRTALGALIIQTKFQYSDRELVEQITENPYLQYFIGLPGYQDEPPFDPSTLVLCRKRINAQMIAEANDYMLSNLNKKNDEDDDPKPPTGGGEPHCQYFATMDQTYWQRQVECPRLNLGHNVMSASTLMGTHESKKHLLRLTMNPSVLRKR